MTDSIQTTAERVEQASLNELRDVDIDDVYVQMDYLLQSRPTPLDLYNRWENQNWSTQKLDFSEDRVHWDGMSRVIFDTDLVEATERVRTNPDDYGAWVEGITIYHLIVEGMLALTGQKYLLGLVRAMGILPGFYTGFTAVARDESRHVNFGVRALMEAGVRDPSYLERVESTVFRLLESACRIVAAPDRRYAILPEETPPDLLINPYDVRAFSLISLTKRLRTAGLASQACDEVSKRGNLYYENAWNEYEDIHGEEHPRRYFDRLAPAAS